MPSVSRPVANALFRGLCSVISLAGAICIQSCQSSTADEEPKATGQKSVSLTVTDSAIIPDRAIATLPGASFPASISAVGNVRTFNIQLNSPLGADTLKLKLITDSLVTTILPCIQSADGSLVIDLHSVYRDTLARSILRRLNGTTFPKTPQGAITAYAQALLVSDPLFNGFPTNIPAGLDTGKVRDEALRLAAKQGRSLAALVATWGLDLNYDQAISRLLLLKLSLSHQDSSTLFPPPPVRLSKALSLNSTLITGGLSAPLKGEFQADSALVSTRVRVYQGSKDVSNQFFLDFEGPVGNKTSWDLEADANASVQALVAGAGTYTLKVSVTDLHQKTFSASCDFFVLPESDKTGPSIQFVSPSVSDTSVDNNVALFDLIVKADDVSGVDSVYIAGVKSEPNLQGDFHRSVPLDPTGVATLIGVQAFDKLKNSSYSQARITRKSPTGASVPVFRLLSPSQKTGTTIAFDSVTFQVMWNLTDKAGIIDSTVKIRGGIARKLNDSTWAAEITIPPSGVEQIITFEAMNRLNLGNSEFFTITRQKDRLPPVIVQKQGDRSVPFDSLSAPLSWSVSDNHKVGSVSIMGSQVALRADGIYAAELPLRVGLNLGVIVATDSSGNSSTDTVFILRTPDKTGPVIQIISPASEAILENSASSAVIRIKATDPSGVRSVSINHLVADTVAGEYRKAIDLPATGTPTVISIQAVDLVGNSSEVTMRLTRKPMSESGGPVMTLLSPPTRSGTTIPFDSNSIVVRWKIVDDLGVVDSSVKINGLRATKENDSVWSRIVSLPPSGGPVLVVGEATNTKGVGITDIVSATRKSDSIAPKVALLPGVITSVPSDSAWVNVGWTVTDNHKLRSVTLNGQNVTGVSNVYSQRVMLIGPLTTVRLVAIDSTGNATKDSVAITRGSDVTPPSVSLLNSVVTTLPFATASATVGWNVSDNHKIGSVTINGQFVAGVTGSYSLTASIPVGLTMFRISATDSTGNVTIDSVTITRGADISAPSITRGGPSSPVLYSSTTTVSYIITDNDAVSSVTINGVAATKNGNSYSRVIGLEPGDNKVSVVASDASKNIATDDQILTTVATDNDNNSLRFARMPDGKVWTLQNMYTSPLNATSSSCSNGNCSKFGRLYTWSGAMNLPANCDNSSCPLTDSLQHQGLCPVKWHVPTATEWNNLIAASGFTPLKSTASQGKWYSWQVSQCSPNPKDSTATDYSGSDTYGFSLLPTQSAGGYGGYGNCMGGSGRNFSIHWTATQTAIDAAGVKNFSITSYDNSASTKASAAAFRCVAN